MTNAQYARFLSGVSPSGSDLEEWIVLNSDGLVMSAGGGYEVDDDAYEDHPVVKVSWWCGGVSLPTELEASGLIRSAEGIDLELDRGTWDFEDGTFSHEGTPRHGLAEIGQ